jgi:HNH endonuclease
LNPIPKLAGKGGCHCGRRGLPREWVYQMYEDYQILGSLEKVGKLHGRTRQNMFGIFQTAGLKLNPKKFLPAIIHKGVKYTEQKTQGRHRYLRGTLRKGKTLYLHHVIWEENNGPIPLGFKVCFKDGNHLNCTIGNLELLSNSDQVRKYATKGHNQFTVTASARLKRLIAGSAASTALKRRAA